MLPKQDTTMDIADIIMVAIGMIVTAAGAFFLFTAITKNLFLKNAGGTARVRCAIIGAFLLCVGLLWLIFSFSGE